MYIITELMVNGALLDYLRKDEGRLIKLKEIIDLAAQVGTSRGLLKVVLSMISFNTKKMHKCLMSLKML